MKKVSRTKYKVAKKGTGRGNRRRLKALNDTKLVLNEHEWPLNHLGSIWYHSEPLEVPYSQTSILVGTFFAISYSKPALVSDMNKTWKRVKNTSKEKQIKNCAPYNRGAVAELKCTSWTTKSCTTFNLLKQTYFMKKLDTKN